MKIYTDGITKRNKEMERLVVLTQEEMKQDVYNRLRAKNKDKVRIGDGYVFYQGTFPVLLCSHMDTVHKQVPKEIVYAGGSMSSPQGIGGDDRCGIYMCFEVLKYFDCSVVFLEDEEIGCVGANKFIASNDIYNILYGDLKYIIEFDRKGSRDAVSYDCENKEFDNFICKDFFVKAQGTCSDISYLAPVLEVAAVNLSCGYYNEHHLEHWIMLEEMETVIKQTLKVLTRTKELTEPFKYIEKKKNKCNHCYDSSWWYNDGYYSGYNYYDSQKSKYNLLDDKDQLGKYAINFRTKKNKNATQFLYGETKDDALLKFLKKNPRICYDQVKSVIAQL